MINYYRVGKQYLLQGDCLEAMMGIPDDYIDVVVTSPPYNIGTKYTGFKDNVPRDQYLEWTSKVFRQIERVLAPEGSFFLNMGFTSTDPWIAMDVANRAREYFVLQNHFCWVKAITLDAYTQPGLFVGIPRSYGHFKPVNSDRFVNNCWEHLFHFTKTGKVKLDRLAVGTPYKDKSNLKRGNRGKNGDIRCRGNTWYIPYETIQFNSQKGGHPAIFPEGLVERCIRLHGLRDNLVVLDPFVGTGTTLVVCQKLGITGTGIDIDPTCIEFSLKRLNGEITNSYCDPSGLGCVPWTPTY